MGVCAVRRQYYYAAADVSDRDGSSPCVDAAAGGGTFAARPEAQRAGTRLNIRVFV